MFDLRARILSLLYWKPTRFTDWYDAKLCFGQFGEDAVLGSLVKKEAGFYVDVGAHHPIVISNTLLLHRRGWRGINIEPTPGGYAAFLKERPADINVQAVVLPEEGEVEFFRYSCAEMNTACRKHVESRAMHSETPLEKTMVRAVRLDTLLDQYLPKGTDIDLLNIDCEGSDLQVLQSNDWNRFRPEWILIEDFDSHIESEIHRYLAARNYALSAFWQITKIFKNSKA